MVEISDTLRSVFTATIESDDESYTFEIPASEVRHDACDGCGLVVDTLAALTRFRVELGHLEGPIQLCARCSPGGLATYWTRDLEEHLVATPAE